MKQFLISCMTLLVLSGCGVDNRETFQGYIENDMSFIASPYSGKLEKLPVTRGSKVKQDDLLFALDTHPQSDDVENARANVQAALSNLMDMQKGARPEKLDQIKAQILQVEADLEYNQKEWLRRKELVANENIQVDLFDQATRNVDKSSALIAQYEASLDEAGLPAREDQLDAAFASLEAARALLQKAEWVLAQKTVSAPQSGTVFDTYYNVGEQIPANVAVVSLLIPSNTKAIVFVPETELGRIKLGGQSHVSCDGCAADLPGKISYISSQAEYTPPVIYSRENRAKLVYRVEVSFKDSVAKKLHPGQPVDVTL